MVSTQLSLSQAAKSLNVSEKSIRRYIKAGRMKAILIKGQKGYEYRIEKGQLKNFAKPPRGKNSHKKLGSKRTPKNIARKNTSKKEKIIRNDFMSSVKEIAQKRMDIFAEKESSSENINYKILYEKLLAKYEQSLIMIGNLEAQLKGGSLGNTASKGYIREDQEDTILELYQLLRQNQKNHEI